MKTIPSALVGTPLASATSGSKLAKLSGRQIKASANTTTREVAINQNTWGSSTAIIWPVSRPNLLAARPS
ncbi:unannotated protein [freshwater metagenome]|uniref:Unannotated protein n=1 Tax=freshwater metagenome TaxID=449393 RepID=A0A6J6JPA6_9ZZZZ